MSLTHLTGPWRIALPLQESADGLGAGAPPEAATPAESESLSDHEASYSPDAQRAAPETDDAAAERDDKGQFKPRRRAVSQRADADDVEAINAHTKRIKTAEEALGKDITRKDGESDRVYNLRRRAELLERQSTAPTVSVAPTPTATPQPAQRHSAPIPDTFPTFDEFITIQGRENTTWDEYSDLRVDWRYARARDVERQREAADQQHRTHTERTQKYASALPATKAKYADFDAVVRPDVMVNGSIVAAIMASDHGPEIAYYLGKHHDERAALNAEHPEFSQAAVPALRRYLDTLVASQRLPVNPSRTAAGTTGAALALAPPPAPRPPTPVRTGSIQAAEQPPDDNDMSLASHEKHFGGRRRR